jgi:simple sugar transport system ATP-binding protein
MSRRAASTPAHRRDRSAHQPDEGYAVVVISSYLPEIMAPSDRILVARQGKIIEGMSIERTEIMYAAVH